MPSLVGSVQEMEAEGEGKKKRNGSRHVAVYELISEQGYFKGFVGVSQVKRTFAIKRRHEDHKVHSIVNGFNCH